jgi:hypothetical protein
MQFAPVPLMELFAPARQVSPLYGLQFGKYVCLHCSNMFPLLSCGEQDLLEMA